jgi:hypothetical protein
MEIDRVLDILPGIIMQLRELSPFGREFLHGGKDQPRE